MNSHQKKQFKNILAFVCVNFLILMYIAYGSTDEERYQDGIEAYQAGNFYKTFNLMTTLVKDGYIDAEYILATLYEKGEGVEADEALAMFWYEKSAQHGNKDAQAFLKNNGAKVTGANVKDANAKGVNGKNVVGKNGKVINESAIPLM